MTTTTTKMMNMGEERRRVILSSNPPCSRRFVGRRPPVGMFPSRPRFRPLDSNLRCDERARFSFAFGVSYLTLRSFVRSVVRSFACFFAMKNYAQGTWSDGKLTTRIGRNSGPVRFVLETLVKYGAPEKILVEG